jgi:hypothetical protein
MAIVMVKDFGDDKSDHAFNKALRTTYETASSLLGAAR